MNKYSKPEKYLASVLSSFPSLKKRIKKSYQYINYLIYQKKITHRCDFPIKKISYNNRESFFGYYDKSPINKSNSSIIFHSLNEQSSYNRPDPEVNLDIILYNIEDKTYKLIDKSLSYNWQQGTRLQWLNKHSFIYNVYENGKYSSKIFNIKSNMIESKISKPIYDCYLDHYALSLNFSRLGMLGSDYGYWNSVHSSKSYHNPYNSDDDGIFYINLKTGMSIKLISIEQIAGMLQKVSMKNCIHKFNHIMISPDGNNFIFIHRWYNSSGKRYDRLVLSDISAENICVLSDDDMVSHCYWYDNLNIIAYLRNSKMGDNFYILNIESGKIRLLSDNLCGLGDGHPSTINNKMLFDSYPDKSRMKHLYVYNLMTDDLREIGEFYEPMKYNFETRCDLHPKWSYDGGKIFFDSVHEDKRYLYYMEL